MLDLTPSVSPNMTTLNLKWPLPGIIAAGLIAFLAVLPGDIQASSFILNEQSVSGLGTTYAGGAAQASDASTIFFNPAGIALLDFGESQVGVHGLILSGRFSNSGSRYNLPGTPLNGIPLTGGNGGDAATDKVLPNYYFSMPVFRHTPYGDLSIGLGLSVPFGLGTDYAPGWVGRYLALRSNDYARHPAIHRLPNI
jgi:long-chain fatty acid transport protein